MGAREDILAAAKALVAQGYETFSPAQIIRTARDHGCGYPDTTLRTYILGPMCINSPDHHAVQYGDLERVGRGQYRLVIAAERSDTPAPILPRQSAPSSSPQTRDPAKAQDATAEWYWEGNVQAAVVNHLVRTGWSIQRVAGTKSSEQGIDIEARRDDQQLLVEVKGYPSVVYVRGEKAGLPKSTPPSLQARSYFSGALLTGLLMRSDHPEARVVLAFPAFETYRALASRVRTSLERAGIELWLVSETGDVREHAS
jgi:hypothetical protein